MHQIHAAFETRTINRDLVNLAPARGVAKNVVALASAIQSKPEAERLMAVAVLFTLVCKTYGINPLDLYDRSTSVMQSHDTAGWNPEFRALRDYLAIWSTQGQAERRNRKTELTERGQSILNT